MIENYWALPLKVWFQSYLKDSFGPKLGQFLGPKLVQNQDKKIQAKHLIFRANLLFKHCVHICLAREPGIMSKSWKIVKICTKKSSRFTTFFTLSFQNISISTKKQSFSNWPFVFSWDISVDNLAPFVSCFVKWLSRPQPISQPS